MTARPVKTSPVHRKPAESSQAARHGLIQHRSADRRRLTFALLLSLLIHVLLLRVTFGGQGLWLPGFAFPWQDRRIEVPDLRVVLIPAPTRAAEPLQQPRVEQTSSGPSPAPSVSGAPTMGRPAAPRVAETNPSAEARAEAAADPKADAATDAAAAQAPADPAPPPIPAPAVIDLPRSDAARLVVPATPQTVVPSLASDAGDVERDREQLEVAQQEDVRQKAARAESARLETERQEAVRIEAARAEVERQEAARVEAARLEATRVEAARVEVARLEAARVESARVEFARLEAARVEAARIEAARIEAARIEAARIETARIEAARIEAARQEAERQEAERIKAAKIEAARIEAEQDEARRDAARRALGRLLDEEADRRDAAKAAARQSPEWSTRRRYRLFGRTDPNAEIILYAEAWSRKIQLNMTIDMVREAAKERHTDPVVTVAVRSDGSVESVTFVRSSGVAAIDEAIRRIVDSQKPYPVFPPGLASEYDVIEIRRTWHFDIAVRMY